MLNLDALTQVTDIVCHENCADGTVSAMFLHDALPFARVRFCQYGVAQEKLEVRPNMLFCDFSPHETRYQEFVAAGAIVLDHHKSARHIVEAFGDRGIFADEATEPGVSGAVLAYRHVWRPLVAANVEDSELLMAGNIARIIGVRDTWQKSDLDWDLSRALSMAVKFFAPESWLTERPFALDRRAWWLERQKVGERLVEKDDAAVRKALEGAYRFTSQAGTRVLMFQGTNLTSDAAEAARLEADIIVGFDYFAIVDGQASLGYSLRAGAGSKFDCATFSKGFGGGGHSKAAGFSVRFDPALGTSDPFSLFGTKISEYEAETRI